MDIERARKLKVGDVIYCPADRGESPYQGQVAHVPPEGSEASQSLNGQDYLWIEVWRPGKTKHVWPSNRLSLSPFPAEERKRGRAP